MKKKKKKKYDKKYVENLEKYIVDTSKAAEYSIERFDILIISLSSTALIFSIGFVKDIIINYAAINPILLKLSWLFFGTAIVSNLFSQVTAYFDNRLDVKLAEEDIRIEKKEKSQINYCMTELIQKIWNRVTKAFNVISFLALNTGVVLLIIFVFKYA